MQHNLVLSGGGMHTIAFLGSIKYLTETDRLSSIKNILGSSGGSIIALMAILDIHYTRMEVLIKEFIKTYNEQKMYNFSVQTVLHLYNNLGLFGKEVNDMIVKTILTEKNLNEDITFMELTKITGKNLIVSVSNLSQKCIEYISVDTYPAMAVKTAIAMSTAIPIVYKPIKYYNDIYVDSLVYDQFPIHFFSKNKVDTLGLKVKRTNINNKNNNKLSFTHYLFMLFNSITYKEDQPEYKICTILIDDDIKNFDIYKLKFVMDDESFEKLIKSGYEHLKMFFTETD